MGMQSVRDFQKEIDNGRLGKNIGISTGLLKLDSLVFGIQKRSLYLVGSDSGAGKSSFMINIFIYNLLKNRGDRNVSILLYSFEMSTSVIYAKLLSLYIWDKYDIFVTYEDILSLTQKLPDNLYEIVKEGVAWLEGISQYLIIYDKPLTPGGIYATTKEWLREHGEFITLGEHKEEYHPKDEETYKVIIWDHMG